jgi:hypothetical protein
MESGKMTRSGEAIERGARSPAERDRVDERREPEKRPPERIEPHDQRASPAVGEALAKGGLEPSNAPEARRHPVREDYGRGSPEGSKTAIREAGRHGDGRREPTGPDSDGPRATDETRGRRGG